MAVVNVNGEWIPTEDVEFLGMEEGPQGEDRMTFLYEGNEYTKTVYCYQRGLNMNIKFTYDGEVIIISWDKFAKEAPQTKHEEEVVLPQIHKQLLDGEKVEWNGASAEMTTEATDNAKFLIAVNDSLVANKLLPDGGKVEFEDYSTGIEISDITATKTGVGWGTWALGIIVEQADEFKIDLYVIPVGKPGSPKHERLVRWYEQFMFEETSDGIYCREYHKGL
jgi:hypothetical protein